MAAEMALTTEAIWIEFHANLLRFVARRVRNPADAEDVVQRVFVQVHRALPTLRDADRLPAWLYQTTRRVLADYYRAPAARRELTMGDAVEVAGDLDAASTAGDPDAPTALAELSACLRPLMASLSAADQEALTLIEFGGMSQVDAAHRLGVSVSGMKSRVQRARTRLRSVVEACCRVELDGRGGVSAFQPRSEDSCGCGPDKTGC
jgi:RNA polymerase sigma-70 factor (ECF subfamily)